MGNTINYKTYPPVIHYMDKEYIGGPIESTSSKKFKGIYYDFRESLDMQFIDGIEPSEGEKELYNMIMPDYFIPTPPVNRFTRDENGLQLASTNYNNAYIRLPFLGYRDGYDAVFEFETGVIGIDDSRSYDDLLDYPYNGSSFNNGGILAHRGTGANNPKNTWAISAQKQSPLQGTTTTYPILDLEGNNITDVDFFSNCVIKITSSPIDSRGFRIFKNNVLVSAMENLFVDIGLGVYSKQYKTSCVSFGTTNTGGYSAHPMTIKWFKEYYEPIPEEYIIQ